MIRFGLFNSLAVPEVEVQNDFVVVILLKRLQWLTVLCVAGLDSSVKQLKLKEPESPVFRFARVQPALREGELDFRLYLIRTEIKKDPVVQ
jgi:hypothetical protein